MTTTALPAPADLNLSLITLLTVVSMAARNRSLQAIADATTLPIAVVDRIARHYGAPNLGALADQAEALRAHLDAELEVRNAHEPTLRDQVDAAAAQLRDPAAPSAHDQLEELRGRAAEIGSGRLVKRADWLIAKVNELRTDLEAQTIAHDAAAAKAAAQEQAAAAAKAKIAKLRAQIRELDKVSAAGHSTPSESATIRAWAAEAGLVCPQYGRVPNEIRAQFAKAHQA